MDFNSWNIFWSLCFGLLATLIVVGNVLTIWIFLKQRLRKRAHFLLISLAVADLLVGLLITPFYMAVNAVKTGNVELVFTYVDVFSGITSIFTLAVISLERMCAICWPVRHRNLPFSVYMFAIAIPWILAAIFASIVVLHHMSLITRESFLFPLILFQSTPLIVMCIAYCVVWEKQKSLIGNQVHAAREAKLAKTLFIITGASILTWLPFQILNLLSIFRVTRYFPYIYATVYIIKFLQFSNSLVNVIIYPFRISEFKNALLQIFQCFKCPCQSGNRNEVAPMQQERQGQLRPTVPSQELQVVND